MLNASTPMPTKGPPPIDGGSWLETRMYSSARGSPGLAVRGEGPPMPCGGAQRGGGGGPRPRRAGGNARKAAAEDERAAPVHGHGLRRAAVDRIGERDRVVLGIPV